MLRILLIALLLSFSAPALAVYKCESGGKITYSEAPCPGGKVIEANDNVSASDAAKAKQQAAKEKMEATRLEKARHQREAKEEREQKIAARSATVKKTKCASMAQRKKWSEEDAAKAVGKSAEKARLRARRMGEKYELDCEK